jgi:hypothetical protein
MGPPRTFAADAVLTSLEVEEIAGFYVVAAIESRPTEREIFMHFAPRSASDEAGTVGVITSGGEYDDIAISSMDTADRIRVMPLVVAERVDGNSRVWASLLVGCGI